MLSGGSKKILSDNGTEFKNQLFEKVAKELGVEFKCYTAPYHPQSNGRIEGFHHFLKACMSEHISKTMEWDEVVHLATAAYNFFPNEHSRESPFFLMFGRDPRIPLNTLLQPKIRYMGTDENILSLEALQRIYYMVAENVNVNVYVKQCKLCQKQNIVPVKYSQGHFSAPMVPMEFISMDLIGDFIPSSKGNKYALTVICMLTGYTFCIPIPSKRASEVVTAYVDNVYAKFGGSKKILSDNGTEFKNQLFEKVAKELGVEFKCYTAPYHPQSNGRIEGFHHFLKACMSKHISKTMEWDEVVHLATAAYNFFPNEHSRESPFFLMFGRDPRIPLNTLLQPKIRYMGTDENILSLEALQRIYFMVAENLKLARERQTKQK